MDWTNEAGLVPGTEADFSAVYADLQKQFAPCEVYPKALYLQLLRGGKYRLLLYRRQADGVLLGYALVYLAERTKVVWADYLAVLHEFHGQGAGKALFRALFETYCGPYDGLMFSVEHVCENDPALAQTQRLRLEFYRKLGAHRLRADYLQPTPEGGFPMYLYFKPKKGVDGIGKQLQAETVADMYRYCFSQWEHTGELLPSFADTIADEVFTD